VHVEERRYFVYILASRSRALYVGITSRLLERVKQHRLGFGDFTTRYRIHRLVHFEVFSNACVAIKREKEIKGWRREKKIRLIEMENPLWEDLAEKYFFRYPSKAGPSPAKDAGSG
jgi:putative endonuclease